MTDHDLAEFDRGVQLAQRGRGRDPRRIRVSEARQRPPAAGRAPEPVPGWYDRLGVFLLALLAILAGLAAAAQLGAFGPGAA